MTYESNWRTVFVIGALVALVGTVARTTLKETVDFIDAKRRLAKTAAEVGISTSDIINELEINFLPRIKIENKTIISLFLICCTWPVWFYLSYSYCANILQSSFNFTIAEIINQNFYVSLVQLMGNIILTFLCYKINPLTISKIKAYIFFPFLLILPYIFNKVTSCFDVFLIQSIIILGPSCMPSMANLIKCLPILKRFTITSFAYAISRAIMYLITSVGVLYLTNYFGTWGISIITLPVICGYFYGIHHFIVLTNEKTRIATRRKAKTRI